MKRVLVHLESGTLADIVEPGSEFEVAEGLVWVDAPDDVSNATHEYRDDEIVLRVVTPTEPAVPRRVDAARARIILLRSGLLDDIEAFLAAIPGDAGREARIRWEFETHLDRDDPLLNQLAAQIGMSPEQLDGLFVEAGQYGRQA